MITLSNSLWKEKVIMITQLMDLIINIIMCSQFLILMIIQNMLEIKMNVE